MLETDVLWDAAGRTIRNPADPQGRWITVTPPDMPENFRVHNVERLRRERPAYTIHPDNAITVSQYNIIRGDFPPSWQEMQACDDRVEKLLDGTIRYTGPLRPLRWARRQRAGQDDNIDAELVEVAQGQPLQEDPARVPQGEQALARDIQPIMVTVHNNAGGNVTFQSAGPQNQQICVDPPRVSLRKAILMALAMSIGIAIIYWVFPTSLPSGRAFEGIAEWAKNLTFLCRVRY